MKILVFDDESRQRQQWRKRLDDLGQGEVFSLEPVDFREQVERLEDRRRKARKGGAENLEELGIESEFDVVDVLVIDYDLLRNISLTGEEIAYLIRCFSKCGLVVALNQFGDKRFNLTLQQHPESFADLNIGETFLDDPGLWSPSGWKEFRPWHWPLLPKMLDNHKKRIEDAREWMGNPILTSLSLDESSAGILHRKTLEFIQGSADNDVQRTTFEDFVITSGKGLKRRDAEGAIEELKPHVAAARLHRWLESFVLGGQEILVDAPHLVTRFPSLLEGSVEDVNAWNRVASLDEGSGINREILQKSEFPNSHWLSRGAWYWHDVRESEGIQEVADPWSIKSSGYVFCEDTSRFAPQDKASCFVADLPSAFNRRYVLRVEPVEYHPGVRFSL